MKPRFIGLPVGRKYGQVAIEQLNLEMQYLKIKSSTHPFHYGPGIINRRLFMTEHSRILTIFQLSPEMQPYMVMTLISSLLELPAQPIEYKINDHAPRVDF